jgi:hypothetical protein
MRRSSGQWGRGVGACDRGVDGSGSVRKMSAGVELGLVQMRLVHGPSKLTPINRDKRRGAAFEGKARRFAWTGLSGWRCPRDTTH